MSQEHDTAQLLLKAQEKRAGLIDDLRTEIVYLGRDDISAENRSESQARHDALGSQIEAAKAEVARIEQLRNLEAMTVGYTLKPTVFDKNELNQDLGMEKKQVAQYSYLRAMRALALQSANAPDPWKGAGLELEAHQELEKRAEKEGRQARGLFIPSDVNMDRFGQKRALSAGGANAGADFVDDQMSSTPIEFLRARMILDTLGVSFFSDLQGKFSMPRQTGTTTGYWVAEAGAITESTAATDQVEMSPNAVGAYTQYTRRLLLQSEYALEAFVRNDMVRNLAIVIQKAAIQGAGGNEPTGIQNQTGISLVNIATAGQPTWAEIVQFETEIADDHADLGRLGYLMPNAARGHFKTTPKVAGDARFIWSDDNRINGVSAYATTLATKIIYGNWADLVVGFWGTMEVVIDPLTRMHEATYRAVTLHEADVVTRHPQSFVMENTV